MARHHLHLSDDADCSLSPSENTNHEVGEQQWQQTAFVWFYRHNSQHRKSGLKRKISDNDTILLSKTTKRKVQRGN